MALCPCVSDVAWGDLNTYCEAKIVNDSSLKSHVASVVLVVAVAGASLFLAAPSLRAKEPVYERATLLSMDSQTCGSTESGGKTVAGEIMGTDAGHHTTQEVLCQDYVLQSDRLIYHIRVKDAKHPVLLPVGNAVEFRIEKSSLFLRDPENGKQEHEYVVISMQPRTDVSTARAAGSTRATTAATDTTAEPKP
jgi:hypothetical protein